MQKPRIEAYSFGRMTIGGQPFSSDLVLYPDGRIQDNWRRSKGHSLVLGDIPALLDLSFEKLVIGTGQSGLMRVTESVMKLFKNRGVELEVYPTAMAVERFNQALEDGTVVAGCFHLTC